MSVRPSVRTSPPLARPQGFKPGLRGLKPGLTGLKPGLTGLKPGLTGLKPGLMGLKPGLRGLKPAFKPAFKSLKGIKLDRSHVAWSPSGPSIILSSTRQSRISSKPQRPQARP